MGWLEDLGNAAASVASAVGDAVEAVVETVTETVESGIDVVEDVVENIFSGVRDWVATNTNPILGGLVNIGLGLVKGVSDFVFDIAEDAVHLVADVGHLVADIFRLDFAKVIGDLANIGIGVGEILLDAGRFVTGGYFAGAIKDNFERDRSMNFIRRLLIDEFGDKQAEKLLKHLGFGTARFGLRMPVDYSVLRMDSATYPLAADHNAGVFDLFALAGVLSFNSFNIARERTRVVMVDSSGNDQWYLPVGRSVIQSFLDSGSPRLRVYAWENYAASRAMRFARQRFRKLCILLNFGSIEYFSRFQAGSVLDITSTQEYSFPVQNPQFELSRFLATRTSQDGELLDDVRAQAIGAFKLSGIRGIAVGIGIHRLSDDDPNCPPDSTADSCVTDILRNEGDLFPNLTAGELPTGDPLTPCGRGVFHRDAFPPMFSKFVLAHELGHHFGLAHAGHDGFQNLMFTIEGQDVLDAGLLKFYYQGDPDFQPEDLEHVWRFIVKKMPHVL